MASRELTDLSISLAGGGTSAGKERKYKYDDGSVGNGSVRNGVNTNYRSLSDSNISNLDGTLSKTLADTASKLSSGPDEKTIMERFAARAGLIKEGGDASRKLTESNYGDAIASQLDENSRNYIDAQEGRAGFGTKTAAVKYLEDTGAKRVRQLEKDRDSLLLQSKVLEAQRLDDLIASEQESITTARKNWLEDIFKLGQESRNITGEQRAQAQEDRAALGFETPQEARLAEFNIAQDTANAEAIRSLSMSAPDAGITSTDTYDEAVTKYRNSQTYKNNQRLGELEIQKAEADIRNTNALASNRSLGGGTSGDPVLDGAQSDLDIVASNAMNLIPSENGKEAFAASLKSARTDADKINAISSVVLANSPAEIKTDFINQSAGMREIDEAIRVLDQGVQTGALQAGSQYLYNIVGKDFDPNLAAINAHITAALQPYRSSVTGAAWGSQEDAEYQSMFGSTKYEPSALRDRLIRLKGILQRKSVNALATQVSPFGQYDIFSGAYGNDNSGGSSSSGGGNSQYSFSDEDFGN